MSKQTNKSVKMIDVGSKKVTKRVAVAEAFIHLNDSTKNKIYKNKIIKGDVISVAKTAGIVAAKKTSDIIPLCHQIPLNSVEIEIKKKSKGLQIISTCNSSSQTGVEMEALLSVSISALTIYDMCKSLDKSIEIRQIRLLSKKGGKSGNYKR
ncbi:MAG: Cyclic pyranopterin monophosphate synthase accessory protein [Alphaproteobacteria bacterium MarineAlpha6_Bin5]|nr:MAG: Cyclic pyranopterin monophosphate synthase accessory protein [Alphaproteobacteria bacterium MarineAlpha6_Bin5]|tara:strand:+ start:1084 stop:1539 length:456 start_codon:yes stop_codon:yes gene_type:complete